MTAAETAKPTSERKTHAGGRPRIGKAKEDAIVSLYNQDMTIKQISEAVGVSVTTIYRVLHDRRGDGRYKY